jgi:hypothetical protein
LKFLDSNYTGRNSNQTLELLEFVFGMIITHKHINLQLNIYFIVSL